MGSYVYLIQCEKYHKIGIAYRLDQRLRGLQTGNPFKLDLKASVLVDDARALETQLHQNYSLNRTQGEWFELTDNDVQGIIKMMLDQGGVVHAR